MALEVRIKKSFPDFKLDVEFRTVENVLRGLRSRTKGGSS